MSRGIVACFVVPVLIVMIVAPAATASDQVVTNCGSDAELQSDMAALDSTGGGTLSFACGATTIVLSGAPGMPVKGIHVTELRSAMLTLDQH